MLNILRVVKMVGMEGAILLIAIVCFLLGAFIRNFLLVLLGLGLLIGYPILNGTTDILGFWGGVINQILVQGIANALQQAFSSLVNWISSSIGGFFGGIWDSITGFFGWMGSGISGFFGGVWDSITGFFGGVSDWFSGIFGG